MPTNELYPRPIRKDMQEVDKLLNEIQQLSEELANAKQICSQMSADINSKRQKMRQLYQRQFNR